MARAPGRPGRSSSATVELRGTSYLIAAAPILTNPTAAGEPINQLGIALIAQPSPGRLDSLITAGPSLLTYLGAAMVLGVIGSLLLARWIKRQTLGMEPAEIVALAEQREAIFAGIAEGVIALDTRDRVTMINPLAVRLLSYPATLWVLAWRTSTWKAGYATCSPVSGGRTGRGGHPIRSSAGLESDAGAARRSPAGVGDDAARSHSAG